MLTNLLNSTLKHYDVSRVPRRVLYMNLKCVCTFSTRVFIYKSQVSTLSTIYNPLKLH